MEKVGILLVRKMNGSNLLGFSRGDTPRWQPAIPISVGKLMMMQQTTKTGKLGFSVQMGYPKNTPIFGETHGHFTEPWTQVFPL